MILEKLTVMERNIIRCEKCNEVLRPEKIKWLELSNTDGNYYVEIPDGHQTQGFFPFGTKCATNHINETIKILKNG